MKKLYFLTIMLLGLIANAVAQGNVGIGTNTPNASSILDINSNNKGVLFPNVALIGINVATPLTSPATGLVVWNTTTGSGLTPGYYYNAGTPSSPNWTRVANGSVQTPSLSNTKVWIGNTSNIATEQTIGGDATLNNIGTLTIANDAITTPKILNNAVTIAKLPSGASGTTFLRGDGTWQIPTNTTYSAGTGLNLSGYTFNLSNIGTAGTYNYLTTDAQGRVTLGALRTIQGTTNQINVTNGNFSSDPVVALNVTVPEALRSNTNMTGGGNVTWASDYKLSWSQRFIIIANGRGSHFSTSGYFDITQPVDGTVITGVGNASNITVTAGTISLPAWTALYYILPIGSSNSSNAANFRVVYYTGNIEIPETWVLVAIRNGDNNTLRIGTGITLTAGQTWSAGTPSLVGSGTTNYVSKFTSANTLGNSQIFDNGTNVGIGTNAPTEKLDVNGSALLKC